MYMSQNEIDGSTTVPELIRHGVPDIRVNNPNRAYSITDGVARVWCAIQEEEYTRKVYDTYHETMRTESRLGTHFTRDS